MSVALAALEPTGCPAWSPAQGLLSYASPHRRPRVNERRSEGIRRWSEGNRRRLEVSQRRLVGEVQRRDASHFIPNFVLGLRCGLRV